MMAEERAKTCAEQIDEYLQSEFNVGLFGHTFVPFIASAIREAEASAYERWAKDVPDMFDMKFDGRWEWFRAILDVPHERTKQSDGACFRPIDFTAFRRRLTELGLLVNDEEHEIFHQITDWLEAHPDVYVEYS